MTPSAATAPKLPRLTRSTTGLLMVDVQEKLLPAMFESQRVVQNCERLVKGSAILGVPIFVTEQYRKGLGPTVPQLASAINGFAPMEKMAFSACGSANLLPGLKSKNVSDVLLCGIETHVCVSQTCPHVCVSQTCLDLLDHGFRVFVAADATSSRTTQNHEIGIERMRSSGTVMVSTEMALLELLESAGNPEFKSILGLIK
jgi:nicotinamidase-related amidase